MALTISFLLNFAISPNAASPPAKPTVPESLPDGLKKRITGRVEFSSGFNDKLGRHQLILTRDSTKLPGGSDKIVIQASQFLASGSKWETEWTINDNLTCPGLDLDADFILPLTTFSDLDSNGIKETTVVYHIACLGGIDPKPTKAIMRQGQTKYAVRGESLIKLEGTAPFGGTFTLEPNLDNAPRFKEFLTSIWKKAAGVFP